MRTENRYAKKPIVKKEIKKEKTIFTELDNKGIIGLSLMNGCSPAVFYVKLFESEGINESKYKVNRLGGEVVLWPYSYRVLTCALAFQSLNDDERSLIIEARRENIFWRGESIENFKRYIKESRLYRELEIDDKISYINKARKALKV